jgi:hypothetical protein
MLNVLLNTPRNVCLRAVAAGLDYAAFPTTTGGSISGLLEKIF